MADELQLRLTARDEISGKLKDVRGELKRAMDDVVRLGKKLDEPGGQKAYDDARQNLSRLSMEERRLRSEMGKNERAIKGMAATNEKSMSKMGRAVDRIRKKYAGMSDDIKKWAKRAAVGMAAAVGAAGVQAIRLASNFEESQNILQRSAGATTKELKALGDLAKQMGNTTSYSAQDASEAMVDLSKAGLSVKDIMGGGVQAAMALAATEGIQMSTAANTAANAMAMFKLEAKDLPAIADALAGGSNASTASVGSLALALAQVGPGAYNSGLSLNETVGVLSAFEQAGIKGSDAGTSLKTMLTRLVPMTDKAAGAMEDLGLITFDGKTAFSALTEMGIKPQSQSYQDVAKAAGRYLTQIRGFQGTPSRLAKEVGKLLKEVGGLDNAFIDSKGNFKDITAIAQTMQDKLGGLTQEQKTEAMATIFGSDATRAAAILTREGAKGLEKYIKATQKKGGAEKMAEARTKGFKGQMEALKGSLETLGIEVGTALLPKLTEWAKWANNQGIPMAKGLAKWIGDNRVLVVGLVAALGMMWGAVKVTSAATAAWTAITKIWLAVTKLAWAAQVVWTNVQVAFNVAMSANPIGVIVVAIVALVGIFVLAYKKVGWFREAVDKAWAWIKRSTGEAVAWFRNSAWPVIKQVLTWIGNYYKFMWGVAKKVWAGITDAVAGHIAWFRNTALPVIKAAIAIIRGHFETVWSVAKTVWGKVSGAVKGAIGAIKTAIGGIKSAFSGIWDGVLSAAKDALSGMVALYNSTLAKLPGLSPIEGWWAGGPVAAGESGWVGEMGPELFLPDSGRPRMLGEGGPEVMRFSQSGIVIPAHLTPAVSGVLRERERVLVGSGGPTIQTGDIYATSNVDVEAALIHAEMRRSRIANERRASGRR